MSGKTIHAWTDPDVRFYPPYVNAARFEEGVRLIVRSPPPPGMHEGVTAVITLPLDVAQALGWALVQQNEG